MKDKLILLVGPSGSGKTTIAKELEKEGYNVIQSYTTRPPRKPGEWGHIFVNDIALEELYDKQDTIIAFQMLYGNAYWATKDQYQGKGKGTSIYVIDPKGAEQVRQNVKDAEVVTIYLTCDTNTLKQRMLRDQSRAGILINDRIRHDKEIFSTCKCDYVVDANREVDEVLTDIKQVIELSQSW